MERAKSSTSKRPKYVSAKFDESSQGREEEWRSIVLLVRMLYSEAAKSWQLIYSVPHFVY
jgi:hypothetical protein